MEAPYRIDQAMIARQERQGYRRGHCLALVWDTGLVYLHNTLRPEGFIPDYEWGEH